MRTSRSGESALLLLDVVELLVSQNIDYAVIGAVAASVHGAVRASMDADIIVSLAVQQARNLERAYRSAGFSTEFSRGDSDDPIPALLKLSDGFANRVDLLMACVAWSLMRSRESWRFHSRGRDCASLRRTWRAILAGYSRDT